MSTDVVKGHAVAIRDEVPQNALALSSESKPLRYSLPELKQIGEIMFASGMFKDIRSVQQAMVKILAGAEQGYGPYQSLRAYHVIEGKPVETSGEISARIKRHPKYDYERFWFKKGGAKWDDLTDSVADLYGCRIIVKSKKTGEWRDQEPVSWTLEDAQVAGLANKDNWRKYKRAMLFSRALTEAAREHCADVFGGPIYTPDELGAEIVMSEDGSETAVAHEPPQPDREAGAPPVPRAAGRPPARESVPRSAPGKPAEAPTSPSRADDRGARAASSHGIPDHDDGNHDPVQKGRAMDRAQAIRRACGMSEQLWSELLLEMLPKRKIPHAFAVDENAMSAGEWIAVGNEADARHTIKCEGCGIACSPLKCSGSPKRGRCCKTCRYDKPKPPSAPPEDPELPPEPTDNDIPDNWA